MKIAMTEDTSRRRDGLLLADQWDRKGETRVFPLNVKIIPLRDMAKSLLVLICATLLGHLFDTVGFTEANIITVYILGAVIVSVITTSRFYCLVASCASVLIFNFFFTVPRYTFRIIDPGYYVTFLIMFIASFLTGTMASKLKKNAKQSAQAAFRTKILLETNQLLQKESEERDVIVATAGQLTKLLKKDIVMYPIQHGGLGEAMIYPAADCYPEYLLDENERVTADWVFRNNKHAGATTETLASARCLYLAIRVNVHVYGVVGIAIDDRPLDSFENSVLLAILGECGLAIENIKNAQEKEAAAIMAKKEQLRANLLRAISHDLRTPLTSISGNASNLLSNYQALDDASRKQIFTDIYDDSMWLINLVENLLAVSRIEEGRVNLNRTAELMDEVITEALKHIDRKSKDHIIRVSSEQEFIFAQIDAKLIVQVIINIVDNAVKYTPEGSLIEIRTREHDHMVEVMISDNGSGIPDEQKTHIFEMFYSGANKVADSRRSLGLGLSLCKSIITAHGGTIEVKEHAPTGATFVFTLPCGEVQLHE